MPLRSAISLFPSQMPPTIPSCLEFLGCSQTTVTKNAIEINQTVFIKNIYNANEGITHTHVQIALTSWTPHLRCRVKSP